MPVFQATFLHYEGWTGPGTAWAKEVIFFMKLAPEQYRTRELPKDHGGALTRKEVKELSHNKVKMEKIGSQVED